MNHAPRRTSPDPRRWGGILLAALAVVPLAAGAVAAAPLTPGQETLTPPGAARAEIRFPAPVRYAILRQGSGPVRTLVGPGDLVVHPQDPSQAWTVERVEAGALVLRQGPRGRVQALSASQALPGIPGLTFTGTVLLQELHYRYKVVDRIRHPDPVVVALEGVRATLEVEVVRPPAAAGAGPAGAAAPPGRDPADPARTTLDGELLAQVRVRESSPGQYEVNAADVQVVLDNAGQVLADLAPFVLPHLSATAGVQYRVTSAAGDGVLSSQGFTVTAPKLAERAGIQVGDTILSVNGQPVDGVGSLYAIFQAARRDPALRTVQVELLRQGTRLTKTYRIR